MDPRVVLGDEVRRRRLAKGLSQERLAEACELHRTYIGGIERGERNVALLNICRLAFALGCSPAELIAGAPALRPEPKGHS
jgi:transcriptional regulator with XRE-family HTH domain